MAKQKIEIEVDVPDGYEVAGYSPPKFGEYYLQCGNAVRSTINFSTSRLLLRRVKQYREPVLPADLWRTCEFSDDEDFRVTGILRLRGYVVVSKDDLIPWVAEGPAVCFKYCRIEKESTE